MSPSEDIKRGPRPEYDINANTWWPISYVTQLSSISFASGVFRKALHAECCVESRVDFLPFYVGIVGGLGEVMRIGPTGQGQCSLR